MYKVNTHNAFEKNFRKLNPASKETVLTELENIQANPQIGESMKGNLNKLDIKKRPIKKTNPEYRVLYKVYNCTDSDKNQKKLVCQHGVTHANIEELNACNGLVDFIICGPREMFNNFYKLPLDKLKKYL